MIRFDRHSRNETSTRPRCLRCDRSIDGNGFAHLWAPPEEQQRRL